MKLCIKCGMSEEGHPDPHEFYYEPDNCQICKGKRGGMKGNANLVHGYIMCDYCHSECVDLGFSEFRQKYFTDCRSSSPDNMCNECDCWKHTRAMCS